jgi:pilus assembly protein TadC
VIATGRTAAVFLLVAAVLAVVVPGRTAARRVRTLARGRTGDARARRAIPALPPRYAAVLAAGAVWLLAGGVIGVVAGVVVGIGLDRALRRLESRSCRLDREEADEALPFAADLLSAVLRAGAPLDAALRCVAAVLDPPLARRLQQVAAAYALGSDPLAVWKPLEDLPSAVSVVRAAMRSGHSGAALAHALRRAADTTRAAAEAAGDAAGQRTGVLVVLPVGLCFLPAFVLLGVVPVAVGVLTEVLSW